MTTSLILAKLRSADDDSHFEPTDADAADDNNDDDDGEGAK